MFAKPIRHLNAAAVPNETACLVNTNGLFTPRVAHAYSFELLYSLVGCYMSKASFLIYIAGHLTTNSCPRDPCTPIIFLPLLLVVD